MYKVVLTCTGKSVDETLVFDHSNESYWAVLSCGTVYHAVQIGSNCKSVNETLVCDHSIEIYWAVFSSGTAYYAVEGASNLILSLQLKP